MNMTTTRLPYKEICLNAICAGQSNERIKPGEASSAHMFMHMSLTMKGRIGKRKGNYQVTNMHGVSWWSLSSIIYTHKAKCEDLSLSCDLSMCSYRLGSATIRM